MPIYEFTCNSCGFQFSELMKIGDDEQCICPDCGSDNTRKRMSSFSTKSSKINTPSCAPTGGG